MRLSILLLLTFLLLAEFSAAEEITTAKQEYLLGETVQAEVNMQNFDISKLSFTDNRSNKIAVGFLTQTLSDRNFVYFNIPLAIEKGEYTLKAKDRRIANGVLGDFEISAKVNVLSDTGLSIDPAIIVLDPMKDEFKIAIKNNAQASYDVNITASQMKATRDVLQIAPGETKNAYISYDISKLEGEQNVWLSYANRSYTVRVLIPEKKIIETAPQPKEPAQTEIAELKFIGPETVEKKASTYTSLSDPITVKSTAKTELKNIKFSLTGSLAEIATIKLQSADKIAPEGSIEQYIWVNKDKKAAPGDYEGKLIVEAEGGYKDEILFKISLEELKLVEEPISKPNVTAFNQSRLAMILNETKVKAEPDTAKSVTIALSMLLIVASIAALIALKLRNKVQKKSLEEYVKGLKKGKK